MNHALVRDSSERPRGEDNVKRLGGMHQVFGVRDLVLDAPRVQLGQILARLLNELGIGVERVDFSCTKRGEAQRDASIAAADFEDVLAAPIGYALQRADFVALRVYDESHCDLLNGWMGRMEGAASRRPYRNCNMEEGSLC